MKEDFIAKIEIIPSPDQEIDVSSQAKCWQTEKYSIAEMDMCSPDHAPFCAIPLAGGVWYSYSASGTCHFGVDGAHLRFRVQPLSCRYF